MNPDLEPTVLVLAPSAGESDSIASMLREAQVPHELLADLEILLDRITAGCGPVVLTAAAVERNASALVRALDAQPSWSDLPLVLFVRQSEPIPEALTALVDRKNTALLRRPVQSTTFLSVVRSAVVDRQRQYSVRGLLDSLELLNDRNQLRINQLRRLTAQLTQIEERERRRLSSLLHDDLQQLLVSAQFRLRVVERRANAGGEIQEPLQELGELLTASIKQTRLLSHELSPPALHRQSLIDALCWLGDRLGTHFNIKVNVSGELDALPLAEDVEIFLYRAVQELLFNVVKHAGTDQAWVTVSPREGFVEISVRDDGRGFMPGILQDSGPAEGLGLFSIAERIELLGGALEVDSEPGRGCRVTLRTPRNPAAHDRGLALTGMSAEPGVDGAPSANTGLRVLIVDDHETLREGVKALLAEETGVAVVGEATNGREALELADLCHPDVVLLDVAMPVMDGLETAARLRDRHPRLRIIGLSTFDHADMGERMLRAGADIYLCKSDPGTELVAAIRGSSDR